MIRTFLHGERQMQFEQPYDQLGSAGGPAGPPRRRVPKVAVAVGLTALFGLGGAGVALALDGSGGTPSGALSSSSSSSSSTLAPAKVHPPMGMFRGGLKGLGGGVIHGEYTVKNGSTYQTLDEQVGTVQGVPTTSIEVRSADGFTQTYTVQSSTVVDSQAGGISTVKAGDTVRVEALVQGTGNTATRTATNIVDVTKIGSSRKGFGLGMGPGQGGGGPDGHPVPAGPGGTTA
jgi:hypothetical protein